MIILIISTFLGAVALGIVLYIKVYAPRPKPRKCDRYFNIDTGQWEVKCEKSD